MMYASKFVGMVDSLKETQWIWGLFVLKTHSVYTVDHIPTNKLRRGAQRAFERPTGVDPIVCSGECKTCNGGCSFAWRENKDDNLPLYWLENSPKLKQVTRIMNESGFFWRMVFGLWGFQLTTFKLLFLWHLVEGSTQHLCHFHIGCPLLYGTKMLHLAIKSPCGPRGPRKKALRWDSTFVLAVSTGSFDVRLLPSRRLSLEATRKVKEFCL